MPVRRLPVYPNLDQLKHQAKDLLRAFHAGDPAAIADLREYHPDPIEPPIAKLADAQLVLARSYEASSWTRLVQAVELVDAIWRDDLEAVRDLVNANPRLIHENASIRADSNLGPPMSYAANVGRDRIIQMLRSLGATDLESAMDRATLHGKIGTARLLHAMLGKLVPPYKALGGPAYTLNAEGTALLAELLLERGADPNVRASIWKRLHPGHGVTARHEYRDVTPLSWGRRFHDQVFVSQPAMRLIEAAGGID